MTNPQDFDRLSAYIDNQLSARERAELELRLAREPELKATLSDLQRTVRVLRLLPVVKPPRRFTLTPAMVGARTSRREPLFPALRLASAFCAIVLAVVLAGDFAANGGLGSPAATARDAAAVTATTELQAPNVANESATAGTEELIQTYATTAEVATMDSADANSTQGMALAAPESTATPEGTDSRAGATVSPTDKSLDATATPESTQLAAGSAVMVDTATPEITADTFGGGQPPTVTPPPPSGPGPLRVFEIAVAILAVLLGLGAWFTRRSA